MAEKIFDTNPTKQVLVDYAAKSLAPYTLLECIADSSYNDITGMNLIYTYINGNIDAAKRSSENSGTPGLKDGQYIVVWDSAGDSSTSKFKLLNMRGSSDGSSSGSSASTVFGGDGGIYDRVKYAENLYKYPYSQSDTGVYVPYLSIGSDGTQTTYYKRAESSATDGNKALIWNGSTIEWGAAGAVLNKVNDSDKTYHLIGAYAPNVDNLDNSNPSILYFHQGIYFKGGSLYHTSDESLKTFITDIDINFDNLATIKKGFFYWNEDPDKIVNVGVSAQTVEALYPQLVTTEMGFKAVDYSKLGVIALAAVDKLYEKIQELEKQIETLKRSKN